MATLYLLRHGNAGFGGPDTDDHDRALNPAGRRASLAMGRHISRRLANSGASLDLVLCSTAARTRQTWDCLAACLDHPAPIEFEPPLYLAGVVALHQRIRALPESAERVMLIGHNPGLHEAALFYCGGRGDVVLSQLQLEFPPAALAVLRFEQPWSGVAGQAGGLREFVTPRDL
ncbi:MAG: histidine phosphatase family protein [Alphaproteobacteria bacterium]|jgi:phosphohistidine phosphatase